MKVDMRRQKVTNSEVADDLHFTACVRVWLNEGEAAMSGVEMALRVDLALATIGLVQPR